MSIGTGGRGDGGWGPNPASKSAVPIVWCRLEWGRLELAHSCANCLDLSCRLTTEDLPPRSADPGIEAGDERIAAADAAMSEVD